MTGRRPNAKTVLHALRNRLGEQQKREAVLRAAGKWCLADRARAKADALAYAVRLVEGLIR